MMVVEPSGYKREQPKVRNEEARRILGIEN